MVMTADEFCHIQIQRFSPPHRQIFLRLCDGLFSLAQISFDFFDTTPANVRAFFILRVKQCRPRPFFPVFRTFKEHHGTFHAVFNTLRITTGAAFAVMPHKNGLTGGIIAASLSTSSSACADSLARFPLYPVNRSARAS